MIGEVHTHTLGSVSVYFLWQLAPNLPLSYWTVGSGWGQSRNTFIARVQVFVACTNALLIQFSVATSF